MRSERLRRSLIPVLTLAFVATLATAALASPAGGDQGCTPGYWKNHTSNWPGSDPADDDFGNPVVIAPGTTMGELFGHTKLAAQGLASFDGTTMLQALSLQGGPGVTGAAQILFRAATAAWLNAADDRMNYAFRRFPNGDGIADIYTMVRDSLGDRAAMLSVATTLDNANNGAGGCPLS
jgi:hypothetical protein